MAYSVAKRFFDLAISAVALALLMPILVLLAVAVRIDSRGPIIYRGVRTGRHGKVFHICKFRSMVADAEQQGSVITTQGDRRVTSVGQLLRRWKLDELPNLFNVLLGEMSLVGPRPESPAMVTHYTQEQQQVLSIRPGIACLAQIRYPNEQAILEGITLDEAVYLAHMRNKLNLDLLYIQTATFLGDLLILVCAVLALLGIQIDLEPFFRARLPTRSASITSGG